MTTSTVSTISSIALEVTDVAEAEAFYAALGITDRVRVRGTETPASGFRGYAMSLVVSQPANADAFLQAAIDAGATVLKPAKKSVGGTAASCRRRTAPSGRWRPRPRRTPARPPWSTTTWCCS